MCMKKEDEPQPLSGYRRYFELMYDQILKPQECYIYSSLDLICRGLIQAGEHITKSETKFLLVITKNGISGV